MICALAVIILLISWQRAAVAEDDSSPADTLKVWTNMRVEIQDESNKNQRNSALRTARAALRLSDKLGSESSYKAISLRELAEVLRMCNQCDQAVSLLMLENRIAGKIPNSPFLLDNLKFTASVLWQEEKCDESLVYDRKALDLMRASFGGDDSRTQSQARQIASKEISKVSLMELKQAKQNWLTHLNMVGTSHIDTLKDLIALADWENDHNMAGEAMNHYKKAAMDGCNNPQAFSTIVAPALKWAGIHLHASKLDDQVALLYTKVLACKESALTPRQRSLLLSQWFDTLESWTDAQSRQNQLRRAAQLRLQLDALAAKTDDPVVKADALCRDACMSLINEDKAACKNECLKALDLCRTSPSPHFETVRVAMERLVNASSASEMVSYCKEQLARSRMDVPLVPSRYFLRVWLAECELRTNWCRSSGWNSTVDAERIYAQLMKEKEVVSDKRLYGYCALRHTKVLYWKAVLSSNNSDLDSAIRSNVDFFRLDNKDAAMKSPWLMAPTCVRIARLYVLKRDAKLAKQWYDEARHVNPDTSNTKQVDVETAKYLIASKSATISERAMLECKKNAEDFNTCEENP